jgi:uncharacterized protein YraI
MSSNLKLQLPRAATTVTAMYNAVHRTRRVAVVLAASVATLAAAATVSTAAASAAEYKVIGTAGLGLNVRTAPSLSSGLITTLADNTTINIICQTRGDNVVGSTMWDEINSPTTGYVADWYTTTPVVNNPTPGLPACTEGETQNPPQTQPQNPPQTQPQNPPQTQPQQPSDASLAERYNGQQNIPTAFARTWHLGAHWSGYCEAFVALVAYGGHGRYPTALADYRAHKSSGAIHYGVPPRGAIVYWNPYNNQVGHVGISLGNGREISTYGVFPQALPIQVHPYNYFHNYLGWAMP